MMIRVMYGDDTYDVVKSSQLDDLILSGKVVRFLRSEGWITVGVDPIRSYARDWYHGPERRFSSSVRRPEGLVRRASLT
jgi:hypothetical protein